MRHMSRKFGTRITNRQYVFLRAFRDQPIALPRLVEQFKIKDWVLGKWLRHPGFRLALAEVKREKRRRGNLAFAATVDQARYVMADMLAGIGGNHLIREVAHNVLEIDTKRRRGRRRGPREKIVVPPPQRAMPPMPPGLSNAQLVELVKRVQGKRDDGAPQT